MSVIKCSKSNLIIITATFFTIHGYVFSDRNIYRGRELTRVRTYSVLLSCQNQYEVNSLARTQRFKNILFEIIRGEYHGLA